MRVYLQILRVLGLSFSSLIFLCGPSGTLWAKEVLEGPIPATIARVIDGDTLEVLAHIWLGHEVRVVVRIAGIDAPEKRGRCLQERVLAVAATDYLAEFEGAQIFLTQVTTGKFAGRVLAHVHHADEGNLGQALIGVGLARTYDGGQRDDWCAQIMARGTATPGQ